jgi:hypothetical protein
MKLIIWAFFGMSAISSAFFTSTPVTAEDNSDEKALSAFAYTLGKNLFQRDILETEGVQDLQAIFNPDVIEDGWGGEPGDGPVPDDYADYDLPFLSKKSGAADRIALEVLYQTLMYRGVIHTVEKKGTRYEFKVVESRSGYYRDLTTLDIAFALKEFSKYMVALMCNDPSQENFSRLIMQTTPEEIGLRFKNDMEWALFGNNLPKEPNGVFALGTKWKAIDQLIKSSRTLNGSSGSTGQSELRSWMLSLGDLVNVIVRLNKLICFVDIRLDPRKELAKRKGIQFLHTLSLRFQERYDELRDLVAQAEKEAREEKLGSIR